MELKEAIEELEDLQETIKTAFWSERYIYKKVISIKTVLKELDTLEEKVDKLTEELDRLYDRIDYPIYVERLILKGDE